MGDLDARNIAVTGGTGALGVGVVAALLAEGAECHIACFTEAERDASPFRDRAHLIAPVDAANEADVESFYSRFNETPLWASVHIAGGFAYGAIEDVSEADFRRQLDMNTVSCFLACREAVKAMRRTGSGGRIVNVTSRPGMTPEHGANMVAYTASKAAVAGITQSLAAEVAGDAIWVNAIAPSIIDTPTNRKAMPGADHSEWPTPDAIAKTILFLVSPRNEVTRGGLIPVFGRS